MSPALANTSLRFIIACLFLPYAFTGRAPAQSFAQHAHVNVVENGSPLPASRSSIVEGALERRPLSQKADSQNTNSELSQEDQAKLAAAETALREAKDLTGSPEALRKAIAKYEEALALYRAVGGQRRGEALALSGIASSYNSLGEKQKALEAYLLALSLFKAVNDKTSEVATLNNIGFVHQDIGELQKALESYSQALELMRTIRDRSGEATVLANVGFLYNALGETSKAVEYYSQAQQSLGLIGDRAGQARTLNNLAGVYESQGEKERALDLFNKALLLWRGIGDRRGEAMTLNNIGVVYDALQRKQEALVAYNQALAILRAIDDSSGEATTLNNLAQLYESLGQKEKAQESLSQALPLWRDLDNPENQWRSGFGLKAEGKARTLEHLGFLANFRNPKAADIYFSQATDIRRQILESELSGRRPTLHILSIGISRYPRGPRTVGPSLKYPLWNIPAAVKDANDFSTTLKTSGGDFGEVKTHLLVNSTRAQILDGFEKVIGDIKPRDTFVFSYSGQGYSSSVNTSGKREFYLMPADFSARVGAPGAISTRLLLALFTRIQAQRRFIVIDARESSAGFDRLSTSIAEEGRTLAGLLQRDVALVTLSEGPRINLVEGDGKGNGLLTYALLKGMQGPADTDGNGVSVREAIEYARSYVKRTLPTLPKLDYYQKHVVVKSYVAGEDFPLTKGQNLQTKAAFAHRVGNTRSIRYSKEHPDPQQGDSQNRAEILGRTETVLSRAPRVRTGKDYALLIASNTYKEWDPLSNPISDAEAIEKKLIEYYGFETEVLRNPTVEEIIDAIRKYKNAKKYAADDQLFIFLAGHGTYKEDFTDGYIIGRDSLKDDRNAASYVSHSQLRNIIDQIPSEHILLVIDACFGGTFNEWVARKRSRHHAQYQDASNAEFIERRMRYRTRKLLTSGGKEYVPDGRPGEHSPFASKLLEALETRGGQYGVLTFIDIVSYVQRVTPEPVTGEWGENEPRSDFLFIKKERQLSPKP